MKEVVEDQDKGGLGSEATEGLRALATEAAVKGAETAEAGREPAETEAAAKTDSLGAAREEKLRRTGHTSRTPLSHTVLPNYLQHRRTT